MTEMLPELRGAGAGGAEIDIAFMQALDAAGAGRSLATLPPPPRVELSMAGRLLAWWHRYWLVWRTLLVFAVTAIISVLVVR